MRKMFKFLLSVVLFATLVNASEFAPTKEEIGKLYVATFNRAPDNAGLTWWANSSGFTLSQIAQSFFDQEETKKLYPVGTSNRDFINSVYQNLFNRAPDTAGWDYWETQLNNKVFSKNSFIQAVINGAQDTAGGMDKTTLENKKEVGLAFANAGLENPDQAKFVMSGVTSSSDTVSYIKDIIDHGSIVENIWDSYKANSAEAFTLVNNYLTNNSSSALILNNIIMTVSGNLNISGQPINLVMKVDYATGQYSYNMGIYGSESSILPTSSMFPLTINSTDQIMMPSYVNAEDFASGMGAINGTLNVVTTLYTSAGNKEYTTVVHY